MLLRTHRATETRTTATQNNPKPAKDPEWSGCAGWRNGWRKAGVRKAGRPAGGTGNAGPRAGAWRDCARCAACARVGWAGPAATSAAPRTCARGVGSQVQAQWPAGMAVALTASKGWNRGSAGPRKKLWNQLKSLIKKSINNLAKIIKNLQRKKKLVIVPSLPNDILIKVVGNKPCVLIYNKLLIINGVYVK